jgi:hypothetical protein
MIQQIMRIVDYSSSEESEVETTTEVTVTQLATSSKTSKSSTLPILPSTFYDLYSGNCHSQTL